MNVAPSSSASFGEVASAFTVAPSSTRTTSRAISRPADPPWTVITRAVIDKEKLVALLRSQISAGNIQGAIKVCSGNSTPLTRIVQAGLMRANRSDEEIASAMEEAGLRELPQLEKRTGYLAMMGNLATLAGLLGTITGLIKSFAGVAGVDPSQKATLLSKGISEAMNCTAFGLRVAIPLVLIHSLLQTKTTEIIDSLEMASVKFLNAITERATDPKPTAHGGGDLPPVPHTPVPRRA